MTDLPGLDLVPLAELEHAYGAAGDVPGHLRALRSADEDERNAGFVWLFSSICHQGTRYAATAPAVPFLPALAADPATVDRARIVRLLGFIAIGDERLPGGFDVRRGARFGGWR